MLISNQDGTLSAGTDDVVCILHDVTTNKYHAAFFEEAPFPGNPEDPGFVRLKSKMHHTSGADTLEGATKHQNEMLEKINIADDNIWREPKAWDGQQGIVWVVPQWKIENS